MSKSYTIELKNKGDDVIMPIPDELMEEMQLSIGDTLVFSQEQDGTITMKKKEDTVWVKVDTVFTYRMTYMVEVPKGKEEWALDTVTCEKAKEFSQNPLGEVIVRHEVMTEEEAIKLCREDNDYVNTWSDEKVKDAFFTPYKSNMTSVVEPIEDEYGDDYTD